MPNAARIMRESEIAVLPTTVWEITRKAAAGALPPLWDADSSLGAALEEQKFRRHPITWEDAEAASRLPDLHRDPMDRLLISVALRENMPVLTCDRIFNSYNVRTIW
jgi:PIN domain nuclease of toxin-antitoxin system